MKRRVLSLFIGAIFIQALTVAAETDPVAAVQAQLQKANRKPAMTYRTNGTFVLCTARCRDVEESRAVYDSLRGIAHAGLSATKEPPTVCVVVPCNPSEFRIQQQAAQRRAAVQRQVLEQRAAAVQGAREATTSLATRIQKYPEALYGKELAVDCEYAGYQTLPGDWKHEVGFLVRENGSALSCVVFTGLITGDPITGYVPVGICASLQSLTIGDKIRICGKLVSPEHMAGMHMRRAAPFFVVRDIQRL